MEVTSRSPSSRLIWLSATGALPKLCIIMALQWWNSFVLMNSSLINVSVGESVDRGPTRCGLCVDSLWFDVHRYSVGTDFAQTWVRTTWSAQLM